MNGNWNNKIKISQWIEGHYILGQKVEINQKSRAVRITVKDPSRKVKGALSCLRKFLETKSP